MSMQPFSVSASILAAMILVGGLLLRLLPHYFAEQGCGVDHWFWKAYIDEYRRKAQFPPVLKLFLLDEYQWYPPIFPMLMARLPEYIFDRYGHIISIAIDMLRMSFAMVSVYYLTARATPTLAAGVVYALTPILISYNVQLNPRGLGALFLDGVIVLLIALIWHGAPWWLWLLLALLSGMILLTHKMTSQLFWFLCLSVGVLSADWRLFLLIPISLFVAIIISKGFYIKVLIAHWDIITFWNRHWPWISSHPVRESVLYGTPEYETPTKYYRSGVRGFWRRIQYLLGFNPWGWALLVVAFWAHGSGGHLTAEDFWIICWLFFILLFVLLTTLVPFMRCLGNGYLYVYNSAFPSALVVGVIWGGRKHDTVVNVILGVTLVLCILGIFFYLAVLRRSKTLKTDELMSDALERLKSLPEGVVMCFPQNWHNIIAYKSHKPVLGGGHGFGFRRLVGIYPRLNRPVKEVIDEYNVKYLLTYDSYLPQNFVEDLPPSRCEHFGEYLLFRFV